MARVNIDGTYFDVEGQNRLLTFALEHGTEIPYFCYHPAMSAPTNCRMCLVEMGMHDKDRETGQYKFDENGQPIVNWMKKPITACNTMISDGMFIRTGGTSGMVKKAQENVLEFMLINHPLDCPICDQAGECPLQIWTYKYGPEGSRFEAEKVHKPKHVELGPRVTLDAERCINCTRCVRFTDEISKTNQLTIINRGEKNHPATAPGKTFDDAYSMNTIDICPVGALTSTHNRFQARVWEMGYSPAIDMNDSTGTNIYVWVRDNEVLRITPRHNAAVNNYWMPDAHRLNVDFYNKNRLSGAKKSGDVPVSVEEATKRAGQLLHGAKGEILFIGSAYASLESNWMLQQVAAQFGAKHIAYVSDVQAGSGDGWLISEDKTPNAAACELLGFKALTVEQAAQEVRSGKYKLVYSLENNPLFSALTAADLVQVPTIVHATHQNEAYAGAQVVLPAATAIEGEGVYVNQKGMPQVSRLAKQIARMTPDMWMRLPKSRLDKGGVAKDNWRNLENIFDVLPSWLLLAEVAAEAGHATNYKVHKDIFHDLKKAFGDLLKDTTVSYKPAKEAFKISQLDFAPAWGQM